MATLTPPLHSIPALLALGLTLDDAVEKDEFEPIIYLLDSAGAGFGYRYEWETLGPFSTELVRDLSQMTDTDFEEARRIDLEDLDQDLRKAVAKIKPLVTPPRIAGWALERSKWLWLLAAVHFLERRSGVEIGNGERAPFVDSYFDEEAIREAKTQLSSLS